jgi:flotillin
VLNGADGLGEIAAGLVSQGLNIFESVRRNLTYSDDEAPPPSPSPPGVGNGRGDSVRTGLPQADAPPRAAP